VTATMNGMTIVILASFAGNVKREMDSLGSCSPAGIVPRRSTPFVTKQCRLRNDLVKKSGRRHLEVGEP
jgi:hypothetical protein